MPHFVAPSSKSQAKRGFTLTELAIVLGVIGVILGAIWSAAAHVSNNQKTSTAVRQILTIASGIKALYPNGTIPGGAQDLTTMAINDGVVPSDMLSTLVGGLGQNACSSTSGTELCANDPMEHAN